MALALPLLALALPPMALALPLMALALPRLALALPSLGRALHQKPHRLLRPVDALVEDAETVGVRILSELVVRPLPHVGPVARWARGHQSQRPVGRADDVVLGVELEQVVHERVRLRDVLYHVRGDHEVSRLNGAVKVALLPRLAGVLCFQLGQRWLKIVAHSMKVPKELHQ